MTKPLSVLLIEDNPGDAELTREILEERKLRVAITVVDNGPDALAYLLESDSKSCWLIMPAPAVATGV